MKPEERFTKALFGIIMILSFFIPWGKWVLLVLGTLFVLSSAVGICWACEVFKVLNKDKSNH